MEQFFDLPRSWRKWTGRPYEALNVNSFDEVPDNSWFTNRNGAVPLSLAAVRRGDLGALLRKANPLGAARVRVPAT